MSDLEELKRNGEAFCNTLLKYIVAKEDICLTMQRLLKEHPKAPTNFPKLPTFSDKDLRRAFKTLETRVAGKEGFEIPEPDCLSKRFQLLPLNNPQACEAKPPPKYQFLKKEFKKLRDALVVTATDYLEAHLAHPKKSSEIKKLILKMYEDFGEFSFFIEVMFNGMLSLKDELIYEDDDKVERKDIKIKIDSLKILIADTDNRYQVIKNDLSKNRELREYINENFPVLERKMKDKGKRRLEMKEELRRNSKSPKSSPDLKHLLKLAKKSAAKSKVNQPDSQQEELVGEASVASSSGVYSVGDITLSSEDNSTDKPPSESGLKVTGTKPKVEPKKRTGDFATGSSKEPKRPSESGPSRDFYAEQDPATTGARPKVRQSPAKTKSKKGSSKKSPKSPYKYRKVPQSDSDSD